MSEQDRGLLPDDTGQDADKEVNKRNSVAERVGTIVFGIFLVWLLFIIMFAGTYFVLQWLGIV